MWLTNFALLIFQIHPIGHVVQNLFLIVTNAIVKAFLLVEVTITILSLKYKSHPKPKNYNNTLT